MRKPTFEEISNFTEYRANHVALVQKLGRAALDMDFSDHDCDKIEAVGKDQEMLTLRFLDKKGKIKTSKEDKDTLRKVSAKHALNSKHHAEYWDTSVNIRNFNEEDENVIHASNMPKRYLAEMACDWASCALYHNEPIFEWFNKVINKYLFFTDNQIEYLEDCLKKIVKAIGKENISYPGIKYTAGQVTPKKWKNEKIKEAVEKQIALNTLQSEILDKENISLLNGDLKIPGRGKGDISTKFTGIVKPTDNLKREPHFNNIMNLPTTDVENIPDEDKDNYYLTDISKLSLSRKKDEGYSFDSEVSDTTPMAELTFENPNTEGFFKIALGFKDRSDQKATAEQTRIVEELQARSICGKLCFDNSSIDKSEVSGVNQDLIEGWIDSIQKTSQILSEYEFIDKGINYVVCREKTIFYPQNNKVVSGERFEGLDSIHNLINSLISKRKDLFTFNSKDSWNPSDIYLVKQAEYASFYKDWFKMMKDPETTKASFNEFLKSKILDKSVIGVSLKKLGSYEPTIEDINVDDDNLKGSRDIDAPTNINIPDMKLYIEGVYTPKKRNISFSCNAKDPYSNSEEIISFIYRKFKADGEPYMEPKVERSEARVGKTPISLLNSFKSDNGVYVNDEKHSRTLSEYKARINNLLSQDVIRKVQFIESNFGNIKVSDNYDNNLTEENWRNYVKSLLSSDIMTNPETYSKEICYLSAWDKYIDMLYALAYSNSRDNLKQDLKNIYDWSKKRGLEFAPYILIH